jgi:anhydro-N-acetylmuramic acid kinase
VTGQRYIGLMSGTSLDGIDAVIVEFNDRQCHVAHTHSLPYPQGLRDRLLELHISSSNELEQAAVAGNELSRLYAETVKQLLAKALLRPGDIVAIGCHGQTIRHRPELGFTLQLGNPALLAELTYIDVVADFRSRDIAAGGQGAPLVPAFHQAVFFHPRVNRTILNIGGIANLTYLPTQGNVTGFDSGPGNMLMDTWVQQHLNRPYDDSGQWAAQGNILNNLLESLLSHPYFQAQPPKSTGRDLFNLAWLQDYLKPEYAPVDVQRTLLEFTARTITDAARQHCPDTEELYLCGGGAYNVLLALRLQELLSFVKVGLTDELGIPATWVEAAAFAWLARQTMHHKPGNLPAVTGAEGPRVLGAIYSR